MHHREELLRSSRCILEQIPPLEILLLEEIPGATFKKFVVNKNLN
jgi:hypothetical protein